MLFVVKKEPIKPDKKITKSQNKKEKNFQHDFIFSIFSLLFDKKWGCQNFVTFFSALIKNDNTFYFSFSILKVNDEIQILFDLQFMFVDVKH